jgi:rhamnose utilization protein RhaD (predicted bifunctional aldolase and dehydrogenase)
VETLLHNLFPERYVLHLHPALVNGLTCGVNGAACAEKLLGGNFVWIPICRPGYALAQLCAEKMSAYRLEKKASPGVLLLQNHGIFVAAHTTAEIDDTLADVMARLTQAAVRRPAAAPAPAAPDAGARSAAEKISALFPAPVTVRYAANGDIRALLADGESARPIRAPFTPDHIVYCKPRPLCLTPAEPAEGGADADGSKTDAGWAAQFARFVQENGYLPRVVCVKDAGAFFAAPSEREAEYAGILFLDAVAVAVYAENFGGPLHLSEELTDFILHWETESYRQKVV